MDFNSYGVLLSTPECIELEKVIKDNYYNFIPNVRGRVPDGVIKDILKLLDELRIESHNKDVSHNAKTNKIRLHSKKVVVIRGAAFLLIYY